MKLSSEKFIILATILLFMASSVFLAWRESQEHDPDINKDWWAIYFVDPKSPDNLDFVLENHGNSTEFEITLKNDQKILKQETLTIQKGSSETIPVSLDIQQEKEIQITVSDSNTNKKTFHKRLP